MTREQFENNTNYKMTYEEFQKCDCTHCDKKDCDGSEKLYIGEEVGLFEDGKTFTKIIKIVIDKSLKQ